MVNPFLLGALGAVAPKFLDRLIREPPQVPPAAQFTRTYVDQGNNGTYDEINDIPASGYANINIREGDLNRYGPFNMLHVDNNSVVDVRVWLNGVGPRYSFIPCARKSSASSLNLNFQGAIIENLTASAPASGEVSVTIGKMLVKA